MIENDSVKNKNKAVAKGISPSVQKTIELKDYKRAVFGDKEKDVKQMVKMNSIRSENLRLFSQTILKIGLSPYDDKRYVMMNGISTLAHGYKDIAEKWRKEDTDTVNERQAE
jgi:hypothetical protein